MLATTTIPGAITVISSCSRCFIHQRLYRQILNSKFELPFVMLKVLKVDYDAAMRVDCEKNRQNYSD